MTLSSLRKVWALLDQNEQRNAIKVLAVMIVGAFASAAMVASIFPFLSVLSDPDLIDENAVLNRFYEKGGFESDYDFVFALGLGSIAVIVLANLTQIMQTWVVSRYTQMRVHSISRRMLTHYLMQSYDFFLGRHTGDMSTNVLAESQQVVNLFLRPLADLISSILTVFAVVISLLVVDPVVASVTMGIFASIYGVITIISRRYIKRMGELRARANKMRFRMVGEALNGIKDVKILGCEAEYVDRYSESSNAMAKAQISVNVLAQSPGFAIQIVAFGGIILLCLVLLDPVGLGEREALGDMLPLIGLLAFAGQRLMPELQKLYRSITVLTSGGAAVNRVFDDLSAGSDGVLERRTHSALGLRHTLELDGIKYTYPEANRSGLAGVSVTILAGERIGVVGSSGAGKTTIADVLLGLLHPQSGSIYVDGTEVTQQTLRCWQQTVGYVPQDIFLIDASLAENIALGMRIDEIDTLKIESAARIAQLHEFAVTELPYGYATHIGERGVRLSGGQRQRIGIARALYHDADLIVFDEATSALDNLTERGVLEAIEALPGNKTVLMIAHRLSTVRACDRIIFMQNGQIDYIGTWDELIRDSAAFRALAAANEAA